ncbi:extensin-like [Papaver somniferum]|uniref:extensin-like n=1 Tax=Papaver somniferum TaxID=3469 RepID=UPI000E702A42|nr:extensin-like [Papaver somniferum]
MATELLKFTDIAEAYSSMHLQQPDDAFYVDTGATSHLTADLGTLHNVSNSCIVQSILVANGNSITVTASDLSSRRIILRCNSSGELYPITNSAVPAQKSSQSSPISLDVCSPDICPPPTDPTVNTSSPNPQPYTPPHRRLNTLPTVPTTDYPTSSSTAPSTVPTTNPPQLRNMLPPPTYSVSSTANIRTPSGPLQQSATSTSQQTTPMPPPISTDHSPAHRPPTALQHTVRPFLTPLQYPLTPLSLPPQQSTML